MKYSIKHKLKQNHRRTISKKKSLTNAQKSQIVQSFLEILDSIKLYHWKTESYSQHKATDELHSKLSHLVDTFVETLLGKSSRRIDMLTKHIHLYDYNTTDTLKNKMFEFRQFLVDLNKIFSKKDLDLLTIRDDMLVQVNQFLYLLTLDK